MRHEEVNIAMIDVLSFKACLAKICTILHFQLFYLQTQMVQLLLSL